MTSITEYLDSMENTTFWIGMLKGFPLALIILYLIFSVATLFIDIKLRFTDKKQMTFYEFRNIEQYKVYHIFYIVFLVPIWIVETVILSVFYIVAYVFTKIYYLIFAALTLPISKKRGVRNE